jgi:hypothetical protein
MQSAQVAAVLNGENFLFEQEIEEAARQKANAMYAAITHQQEHG